MSGKPQVADVPPIHMCMYISNTSNTYLYLFPWCDIITKREQLKKI